MLWTPSSLFFTALRRRSKASNQGSKTLNGYLKSKAIEQKFLTLNEWSRPGTKLHQLRGIVLHWTANAKKNALFNWNFFEMRKNGKLGYGSAHFIIDLDGSILQLMPLDEVAYHAGPTSQPTKDAKRCLGVWPNGHTIGIEFTHTDWEGTYTEETWKSGVELCAALCSEFALTECDLYTHNFITGKGCPRLFTRHPDKLVQFEDEVGMRLFLG